MTQHNVRASEARTQETREEGSRTRHWNPPSDLDTPDPRPGYTQKWVAESILGEEQPHHVSRMMREGWRARSPSTAPDFPTDVKGGLIKHGGLILFEMPLEMLAERQAHYKARTAQQTEAVRENIHKEVGQGGPRITKSHREKVDLGKGGVPPVQDDEDGV